MDKKAYTILISSNRKGRTRSLTLSSAWVKGYISVFCILAVVGSAAVLDYVGLLLQTAENKQLKAEASQLKRQFKTVENKLSTLEKSLERVQSFSKKLRLITNVEDQDRSLKLSVNAVSRSQDEFLGTDGFVHDDKHEDREIASLAGSGYSEDIVFLRKAPLDLSNGELSVSTGKDYGTLSIRIDRAAKNTQLTEQGVLQLYDALSERQALLSATPNLKPARGWFTSKFGYRLDPFTGKPQEHYGIDIAAPPGTPVYAPADGVVSYVGHESGYGKLISIDHGFGVVTRFAHNSQIYVEVGQKVKRRDVISAVGSTGRSSGPHVHYEVRVHGVPVDPMNYVLTE